MATQVTYALEDGTEVHFEFVPSDDWHQVGADRVVAKVKDAVRPAVASAKVVLDEIAQLTPADVSVKFGIKVTGTANWLVAKASSDASFEVTLTWHPERRDGEPDAETETGAPIGAATTMAAGSTAQP